MTDARKRTGGGSLIVVRMHDGSPVWEAKWRNAERRQVKRRLGRAWLVADDGNYSGSRRRTRYEGWLKRTGQPTGDYLTEEQALTALRDAQRRYVEDQAKAKDRAAKGAENYLRFQVVALEWLADRKRRKQAKPETLKDWALMLRDPEATPAKRGRKPSGRLIATFGEKRLDEITAKEISEFLESLDDDGLSGRTINKYRQLLLSVYGYASRMDTYALEYNPAKDTQKWREADRGELIVFTPEQVHALMREATSEQDEAMFATAAFSGLRLGELLALRWRDVDFAKSRIRVQRSYVGGILGTPKSRKGRSLPLADQVAQILARLSQRDHHVGPDDLVFSAADGGYLDASAVRRRYKKARDAARSKDDAIPVLRFHDLRHTFGSLAAAGGVDVVSIQTWMGHHSIRTTQRYLHFAESTDDAAKLTKALGGPLPEPEALAA